MFQQSFASRKRERLRLSFIFSFLLLFSLVIASLLLGRYAISLPDFTAMIKTALGHPALPDSKYQLLSTIVFDSRLPRVLSAILVGAALAVGGSAFQAVFRNPLVSPGLLGVLNGCAFGAALGMVLNSGLYTVAAFACIAGLCAVFIGILIARCIGGHSIMLLLLGGIISNALFAGLLSLVKYMADPQEQLPGIVFWLLGSLSTVSLPLLKLAAPVMIIAMLILMALGNMLDALSLGDDEAQSLGVPVVPMRYGVIFLATLISALTVCLAGVVGWIGLLIPHLTRLIWGAGNKVVMPLSAVLGAGFLLMCDDLARLLTTNEIPLGVVTELLGAGCFFLLLLVNWRKGSRYA
ncbi:iron ABC transporter permease [Shewanella sp. NFH-SH190041]|uniref:FecCD family ABC transporter permease n=1 Tax=Shewanella sp. NFH-SH190041 TaxID=2950245 RepID=UPI0021C4036F|nr:iron ABC transporter permease [Shewanella sp. NFH-SH190041]BDM65866.1 iron ABC transporter permease [Shewanella sp. NFH-SH190041]